MWPELAFYMHIYIEAEEVAFSSFSFIHSLTVCIKGLPCSWYSRRCRFTVGARALEWWGPCSWAYNPDLERQLQSVA